VQTTGLPFTAFLTLSHVEPVAALSTTHESRDVALRGRYRKWKIRNARGLVRNVMWYPNIDIVDFLDSDSPLSMVGKPISPLTIFEKQYPDEIKEVRYLAVSTKLWNETSHHDIKVVWPLIDFMSLRELLVVTDIDHERMCLAQIRSMRLRPWLIPEDIEDQMDVLRAHYETYGPEYHPLPRKPSVRVTKDRQGILNGDEMHIILRDLGRAYLDSRISSVVGRWTSRD
jgi:hypothetical protein